MVRKAFSCYAGSTAASVAGDMCRVVFSNLVRSKGSSLASTSLPDSALCHSATQATNAAIETLREGASAMQQKLSVLEGEQHAGQAALREVEANMKIYQEAAAGKGVDELRQGLDQLAGQLAELRSALQSAQVRGRLCRATGPLVPALAVG